METDQIKKFEEINALSTRLFTVLKPMHDKRGMYNAEIRVYDYCELASVITNLIKLCIIAVDHDSAKVPNTIEDKNIDVGLILGIALQLFPFDEFELITEISYLYNDQKGETKADDE